MNVLQYKDNLCGTMKSIALTEKLRNNFCRRKKHTAEITVLMQTMILYIFQIFVWIIFLSYFK